MLEEFDIPSALVDRSVRKMRIISPSNLTVDFGSKTLKPHEHIPMLRREVLDSFLRSRAISNGANLISALVTRLDVPSDDDDPYVVTYISGNTKHTLPVDVVVGADGANSRVARAIGAGEYSCAIAFQECIRHLGREMEAYEDLAEMYVGSDVSPDFYGWVFTTSRAPEAEEGGGAGGAGGGCGGVRDEVCGGGDILCGEVGEAIVRASEGGREMVGEEELKMGYLKEWDEMYGGMFRFMDGLQRVFYGSDWGREALVEMCGDEYVQRMTFESYLYKKMVRGSGWEDLRMGWNTLGSLVRARIIEGV
ncbi:hypothetical protein QJS10_CPA16g01289 [Acorus calamus]|uniref:Geranylgeranyl reductase n=1 Tax=Acorus calamus TaxID=4465 RepID=A0AAV9D4K8_ACOCL|nr:hypothetical protein QJS10_CPA16g01289 [Acorus calamus]